MNAIIFDTETSGFTPPIEVVELAWQEWPVWGRKGWTRYNPTRMEVGAVACHHIFHEELKNFSPSLQAPADLPDVPYLIGHNVDFDCEVIGNVKAKRICTEALARFLWPTLDNHKLTTIYYHLFGYTEEVREQVMKAHGAVADVNMTAAILDAMLPLLKIPADPEMLWMASEEARIPRIMSFGKHKGKPIHEVDRGYMNWYSRQSDRDEYLMEAFRRAGF